LNNSFRFGLEDDRQEKGAEEMLDGMGARFETSPKKSFAGLTQQTGASAWPARNTPKLLHFNPCKRNLNCTTQSRSKNNFVNWYFHGVHAGEIDTTFLCFSDEAWFHLNGYMNSQNNRNWSSENPMLLHKVTLHDVEVVWRYGMSAVELLCHL
jgi:hypothetical protein